MKGTSRFILIGTGWRAGFFARMAALLPERFEMMGVVTTSDRGRQVAAEQWKTRIFESHEAAAAAKPDYVIAAVPGKAVPELARFYARRDIPILFETYCSDTLEEMTELYGQVGGAPIQVAEQYPFQPMHLARIAVANSGRLGRVYQAKVSFVQNYHMLAVLRRLLNIGMELPTVYAYTRENRMAIGPTRAGDPAEDGLMTVQQEMFLLDFGDKSAVGDYESNQQRSWIRSQVNHIRAERGEILNDQVTYLADYLTPCGFTIQRSQAGTDGNLEGYYLRGVVGEGEWLFRNPFRPARMLDDEIAVGMCMEGMNRFANGEAPFYSLAEAFQDQYLTLLIREAAQSHRPVQAQRQIWQ